MSSTSGVDRNNQNQELQRIRDEYQTSEAQEAKRHKKEVETLNKSHTESYNRLHEIDDAASDSVKQHARETLNERDQKYQKEMQDLRNMHNQRLRNLSEKHEEEVGIVRKNRDQEVGKANQTREEQLETLRGNNADDNTKRDQEFDRFATRTRQNQTDGLGDQRRKLEEKFEQDKKDLYESRDKQIGQLQKDITDIKREKRLELDEMKASNEATKGIRQHNFEHNLLDERRDNNRVLNTYRDSFKESEEKLADRYKEALTDINDKHVDEHDQLRERAANRLGDIQRRLIQERDDSAIREVEVKRLADAQNKHVLENANERVMGIDQMRTAQNADTRKRAAKEMNKLVKENNSQISKANAQNRIDLETMSETDKETRRQEVMELQQRNEDQKLRDGLTNRKIKTVFDQRTEGMSEYYSDQVDALKKNQDTVMAEQRLNAMRERNDAVAGLERHIRKAEAQFNEKFDRLTLEFQKDIDNQKTNSLREMRTMQNGYERIISEKDRDFKANIDSERFQGQRKLDMMQEKYEGKLAQIDKRAELDKIELAKRK